MSRFLLVPLALIALTLAGCERPAPVREERPRLVRTVVVEATRPSAALVLPAEVRPRVETRYGFRVAGKLAERYVSIGDAVKRGQRLARLDPQDTGPAVAAAQAQLEAARTESRLARTELERVESLRARQFVSQAQLDRGQAQADAAAARTRAAEAQLAQAANAAAFQLLVADEPGVVTAVEAEAGQVVAAGQPVVRVARSGQLELLAYVAEADLAVARAAREWEVSIPALGERRLTATPRELSPLADPATRTFAVRLGLQGDLSQVALGMSATVRARREAAEVIVLPVAALHAVGENARVWVVGNDASVRAVPVTTGDLQGDTVRVVSGLKPGDRVVTAGASLLVEGQKVRLAPPEAGARQ